MPAASPAVKVTVVVPNGKTDPDAGAAVTVRLPETASMAVGKANVTTAPVPEVMVCVMFAGTLEKTGGVVSCTLTALAVVPAEPFGLPSLAVSINECCPSASVTVAVN